MIIKTPTYPPAMQTTGELSRARRELEHRLAEPLSDERKQVLQGELTAIIDEQVERQYATGIPASWSEQ
jgi:hypothetical protein